MATCYVTFGQKYRHEQHLIDVRAHPDGWFEYEAGTYEDALRAAQWHLTGDAGFGFERAVPLYAFHYDEHDIERGYYPRGCLARFEVVAGVAREVAS